MIGLPWPECFGNLCSSSGLHPTELHLLLRFLAEAPDAHTEGFRQALPFMLRIGSGGSPGTKAQWEESGGGVTAAGPVQFLLPGLLQVWNNPHVYDVYVAVLLLP